MEELKKLNAGDLTTARQGERYIQVTEKNWLAVLSLLERISSQQLNLRTAFDLLLSKEEAQEQLNDLYSEAEEFVQQAGRLSESFASGAERLTMNARTSIGTMEDSAKRSLQDMVRETNEKIYDLTQESRRLMVTQSVVTVALTVLSIVLVTLFALWKVR
jgi:DNA anti-recombination protein RmuC